MNFFVTSKGLGDGGNLGGLAGADYHCQQLAGAVGSQRTFYAYLSTRPANGTTTLHGRDRIGKGPFFNPKGVMVAKSVEDLHGAAAGLTKETALTEKGELVRDARHHHGLPAGRHRVHRREGPHLQRVHEQPQHPFGAAWAFRPEQRLVLGFGTPEQGLQPGPLWPARVGPGSSIVLRLTDARTYEHDSGEPLQLSRCTMKIQRLVGVSALLLVAAFGGVLAAHHSQPGFDPNDPPMEMKGMVAEYRWRNPHVLFFWDVKDENGKVVRWVGEFASIASALARGMTKDTFKVGEEVTVTAVQATAGTPVGMIRKVVKADGTVIGGAAD